MSNTTTANGTSKKNANKTEAEPKSGKKLEGVLDLVNANLQLLRQGITAIKHWMRFAGKNK